MPYDDPAAVSGKPFFGRGQRLGVSVDTYQHAVFIKALANAPIAAMRESAKEVNYTFDSEIIKNLPFKERIDTLAEKKADLLSVYDSWVNVYSETYLVRYSNENGTVVRRLKDFRDSVAVLFSEKERLESELERGGYYFYNNDPAALEAYRNSRANLNSAATIGRETMRTSKPTSPSLKMNFCATKTR